MKRYAALFVLMALGVAVLAGGTGTGPNTARATNPHLTKQQNKILSGFASFELSQGLGATEADAKAKPSNYTPSGNDGCRELVREQRQGQPELPQHHRPRPAGTRPGAERDLRSPKTRNSEPPRRRLQRLPPRRRHLRRLRTPSNGGATWNDATHAERLHPRRGVRRRRASTCRRAATRRSRGTPGATPTTPASSSTAARRRRATRTSRARSTSTGRPGTTARRGTSPGRPVVEHNDSPGAGAAARQGVMTVDDTMDSPFRDRVYVTWTWFAADGTAYIYEAHSNDYGETSARRCW